MVKLRENVEEQLPFVSVLNYGSEEYVGIIINQDQYVTSFYDLNSIKTLEEKTAFLELGETWWWESNRQVPISMFKRYPYSIRASGKSYELNCKTCKAQISTTG